MFFFLGRGRQVNLGFQRELWDIKMQRFCCGPQNLIVDPGRRREMPHLISLDSSPSTVSFSRLDILYAAVKREQYM